MMQNHDMQLIRFEWWNYHICVSYANELFTDVYWFQTIPFTSNGNIEVNFGRL